MQYINAVTDSVILLNVMALLYLQNGVYKYVFKGKYSSKTLIMLSYEYAYIYICMCMQMRTVIIQTANDKIMKKSQSIMEEARTHPADRE